MKLSCLLMSGWLACSLLSVELHGQPPKNTPQRTEIHFDDLKNNHQIIGRLGAPVGTFHTIHGTWKRIDFSSKQLYLLITHIDFKCLREPLLLPENQLIKCGSDMFTSKLKIDPETSTYWKHRDLFCCEYRVFEKIGFTGLPDDYWKETGSQTKLELYYAKENQESRNQPFELTSYLFYVRSKFVKVADLPRKVHSDPLPAGQGDTEKSNETTELQSPGDINFLDLRDRYRVIGRLGKPVGEYSTIRGVWKRERVFRDRRTVRIMRFYVTHIDGRALDKSLDFDQRDGIFRRFSLEPLDPSVPQPEESDVWELRVVESMRCSGLVKGYNSELGYPGCLELNWIPDFKLISSLSYHLHPEIIKHAQKPKN